MKEIVEPLSIYVVCEHIWLPCQAIWRFIHSGLFVSLVTWPQFWCRCLFLSQNISGPQNASQNWDHTFWRILPRGGCSNWWCPGCDLFWTEDKWTALLHCQGHFQSTICWRPVNLFSWALPGHHRETFAASSKFHTRMGDKERF